MDPNTLVQGRDEENGTTQPQRPRSSVPSLLFITFLLFMLTNHSGDEFLARNQYQNALQSLDYQLGNFTAWMNGTSSNFTLVSKSYQFHIEHQNNQCCRSRCKIHPLSLCLTRL